MYCIRDIQNYDIFSTPFFKYMPANSIIFSVIEYRGIFTHIETLSRHTIVYSGIFSTLCSPFNIHDLAIFGAIAYLEPGAYLKPCETLTSHIQNPAIWYYLAIFRHILNLVQHLHTQKPSILEILEYSEPFHNCIPKHIRSPVILTKIYKYSELGYL